MALGHKNVFLTTINISGIIHEMYLTAISPILFFIQMLIKYLLWRQGLGER